jgi:predicted dehydrogenase
VKKKLGISLVGCGIISEVQAAAIQQSENAELISVYSRNPENAARVGEKYDVAWRTSWDEFIANDEIDIVSVCTPSRNHFDYGKLAAEAGKHVVVEKPIEVTLQRGRELIEVCQKCGVKLAVIFQNRVIPEIQNMKKQIDGGALGRLFLGDAYVKWFRKQTYYDGAAWRGTFALDGGGVLINQAIHTIDLLQWIMGDVEMVYGQVGTFTHDEIEGEDTAVAVLRFRSGALGVIEGSTSVQPAMARRMEIHGDKGTAILENSSVRICTGASMSNSDEDNDSIKSGARAEKGYSLAPHMLQFEAIADAIENDTEPPVSGVEALKSLAIVLAVYESSRTNRQVLLDEFVRARINQQNGNTIIS